MLIGYARVSTKTQDLALQTDALKAAGVKKIFTDEMTGSRADRPGLEEAKSHLREGDVFVVWKLDRVGRSSRHLIDFVGELKDMSVEFRSLTEGIDSTTDIGEFFFTVMAALAQMELALIRERTKAGLAAARARGRLGGRPKKLSGDRFKMARELLESGKTIQEVAKLVGVSRSTLYRRLKEAEKDSASN